MFQLAVVTNSMTISTVGKERACLAYSSMSQFIMGRAGKDLEEEPGRRN